MLSAEVPLGHIKADDVIASLQRGSLNTLDTVLTDVNLLDGDLGSIFGHLISTLSKVSQGTSREAFKLMRHKEDVPIVAFLHFIKSMMESSGERMRREAIEFLSVALSVLRTKSIISARPNLCINCRDFISKSTEALISNTEKSGDFIALIMALRESLAEFNQAVYKSVLRRLESVPSSALPAAIYQCLLLFRDTGYLKECFECLFAVLDAQTDKIQARECLAHMKLAISHDVKLSQALVKFCKKGLHPCSEPSSYLLLIMIDAFKNTDDAIRLLEKYFLRIATNLDRAGVLREAVQGLDASKWPRLERILSRVVAAVQKDDEKSLMALCSLGVRLLNSPLSSLRVAGHGLLLSIYQTHDVTRQSLLLDVVTDLIFRGPKSFPLSKLGLIEEVVDTDGGAGALCTALMRNDGALVGLFLDSLDGVDRIFWGISRTISKPETILEHLAHLPKLFVICLACQISESPTAATFMSLLKTPSNPKDKPAVYQRLFLATSQTEGAAPEVSRWVLLYAIDKLSTLCPDGNFIDWTRIVQSCVDEHGCLREELPLLLKLTSKTVILTETIADPSLADKREIMKGVLNGLVECLCAELSWLSSDVPLVNQASLRGIVNGLYQVGLSLCVHNSELSDRAKVEATSKIITQLTKFNGLFSGPNPLINILEESDVASLLQLYLSTPPSEASILSLLYIVNTSWTSSTPRLSNLLVDHFSRLQGESNVSSHKKKVTSSILCKLDSSSLECIADSQHLDRLSDALKSMMNAEAPSRDLVMTANFILRMIERLGQGREDDRQTELLKKLTEMSKAWLPSSDADLHVAKDLTLSILSLSDINDPFLNILCEDLVRVIGKIDEVSDAAVGDAARTPSRWRVVSARSAPTILAAIFTFIKAQLTEQLWIIEMAGHVCQQSTLQGDQSLLHVCGKLCYIMQGCVILTETIISGPLFVKFVEILQTFYKAIAAVAAAMASFKLTPSESFTKLAQDVATVLTRNIYTMLPVIQQVELDDLREVLQDKKSKKKGKGSRGSLASKTSAQISKESKLIPGLIFQMELFERSILRLHHLHHKVICPTFYRSTARDFRIQLDELEAALLQNEDSDVKGSSTADDQEATIADSSIASEREEISLVISNNTEM